MIYILFEVTSVRDINGIRLGTGIGTGIHEMQKRMLPEPDQIILVLHILYYST